MRKEQRLINGVVVEVTVCKAAYASGYEDSDLGEVAEDLKGALYAIGQTAIYVNKGSRDIQYAKDTLNRQQKNAGNRLYQKCRGLA